MGEALEKGQAGRPGRKGLTRHPLLDLKSLRGRRSLDGPGLHLGRRGRAGWQRDDPRLPPCGFLRD